jgi:phosphate-selective porin OprO/OprP
MAMTRQMWTMSCVAGRAVLALALWSVLPVGGHAQPAASTAPPAGAPQDPTVTADAVRWEWDFSWQGWGGLHYALVAYTAIGDPESLLRFDQMRLAGTIGGRLEVDGAAFSTNGSLSGFDDGFELRRARVRLKGDAILGLPLRYKVEFGYVPSKFVLNDFYVAVPDLPYVGTAKFGYFQPSMGLQTLTSSWDIGLMEPAAPLQAIVPGDSPGMSLGWPWGGGAGTWSLGGYGSSGSTAEYGSSIKNLATLIGRITWLPVDDRGPDGAAPPRLVHLGLSGNLQLSSDGRLRFRARPESYIAPYVIDTATLSTDRASTLALEAAWVDGPLSLRGELLQTAVEPNGGGRLFFGGGYLQLTWSATGESRPYDRETGTFGRLRPQRDFGFGANEGWGALELALRASYTDLSDGGVQGGRLSLLMGGVSWHLSPQVKWMFNLGSGKVYGGAMPGRMLIAQMRVGVDF